MKHWLSTPGLFREGLTWKVGALLAAGGCTLVIAISLLFRHPVDDILVVGVAVVLLYLLNVLSRIRRDIVRQEPSR